MAVSDKLRNTKEGPPEIEKQKRFVLVLLSVDFPMTGTLHLWEELEQRRFHPIPVAAQKMKAGRFVLSYGRINFGEVAEWLKAAVC